MSLTDTRVSRKEIMALIAEINNRSLDIKLSFPFPVQRVIVLIVFKNGKFHETKRFDRPRLAKDFLVALIDEVNSQMSDDWQRKAMNSIIRRHEECKGIYIIGLTPSYGWIVANTVITGGYVVYITDIEYCPYCGVKLEAGIIV